LTVTATNATSVTIVGSDGTSYTLSSSGGTQTVSPTKTTTYTATATNAGASVTGTAEVTVTPPNTKPTVTISASPGSIQGSNASTLTVTATNATSVTISGSDGTTYNLPSSGGTEVVHPDVSTTYTAKATGAGGSVTAAASVSVTAPTPIVNISASPASINSGNTSRLLVTAQYASSITVTGSDGSYYTLPYDGNSLLVTPTSTTTYTATATGKGGTASATSTITVSPTNTPVVTIYANPSTIVSGNSSILDIAATNATTVTISGTDGSSYTLTATGGTQAVSPTNTTVYTVTASGSDGSTTAQTTVTVNSQPSLDSIDHVVFMLQENHTFDNYFGMLNAYRASNGFDMGSDGKTYAVDGIDDKLNSISNEDDEGDTYNLFRFTSTCVDDMTSSWLESYGDVSRYDFSTSRGILMDGFVHTAENYAKNCTNSPSSVCAGSFSDFTGKRAMGYYDQTFLNYYYYMASQFALSDRWFSPLSSKSIPNRIATFTGGTTQGLAFDPGNDDHLDQLNIPTIFEELDQAHVSWKIYYTVTQGGCLGSDDCGTSSSSLYPATDFSYLSYSQRYLYENPSGATCVAPTQPSSVVGDSTNSFCIDPNHIAPLSQYYTDVQNGTLPSFAFIEAGYGQNDEHPGSGQSILLGQTEVAKVIDSLMNSPSWKDSVFFLSYDEGGGPYDHVPPVPGHSNDNTDAMVGSEPVSDIPDISTIAVNPDSFNPCVPPNGTPTLHCDLVSSNDPGATPTDAAAVQGFAAQLGFRLPNMVVSPFTREHYVSHIPMDHTAVIKFVENRFIGPQAHLTARDNAQPDLLNFFNFTSPPWETPPTPPVPASASSLGYNPCTPTSFAP
jgi:phospholipase C